MTLEEKQDEIADELLDEARVDFSGDKKNFKINPAEDNVLLEVTIFRRKYFSCPQDTKK